MTVDPPAGRARVDEPVVVMLVKRFPRRSETFILNEVLELRRQGIPLRLIAIMDPLESWAQPEAEALRHEVVYLRSGPWASSVLRLIRVVRRHPRGALTAALWALHRWEMARWRRVAEGLLLVDVLDCEGSVHLHAHFANGPAAVAFVAHLVAGVPFSFTAHAKDLYTSNVNSLAERSAAASFVATCTGANGDYLRNVVGVDPKKVKVFPHGIALSRFATVPRRPQPGRIVSIGRLVPKKGFSVLVKACRLLTNRGVSVDCVIVGDGPLRSELKGQIVNLGLSGRVRLEPGRPQAELLDLLGSAEVFALAPTIQADGDRDGIPNVLLEAMAAGLPVVSTDISGIPEVLTDRRTGRLVPPEDPEALADALQTLLGDPIRRQSLGDAAQAHAWATFGLETRVRPLAASFKNSLLAAKVAERR